MSNVEPQKSTMQRNTLLSLPLALLATVATTACAPLYVQPPIAGNAQVRFAIEGNVELTSVQFWLDGKECTERMRTTPEEGKAFSAGAAIVLHAGKEFAATLQANRNVGLSGGMIHREVCDAGASFTPQPDAKYRIAFVADQSHCKVQVFRELGASREALDSTYRPRKVKQHSCVAD